MKRITLIACLCLLFSVGSVSAAVTHDTDIVATAASTSSINQTITISGGCTDPLLIAQIYWKPLTGVALSGVSADAGALAEADATADGYESERAVAIYYLAGATGSQTVTASFGGTADSSVLVLSSKCGVDQMDPIGTPVTAAGSFSSGEPTANVTVGAGGMAVDAVTLFPDTDDALTVGAGQTEVENNNDPGIMIVGASYESDSGTVTMSWTTALGTSAWGIVAVPINAAAGASSIRRRIIIVE